MSQPARILFWKGGSMTITGGTNDAAVQPSPIHKPLSRDACYITVTLIGWCFAALLGWGAGRGWWW